ncbi:hypothetical protein [Kitasatospora sp. NPDC004289]
MRVRTVLLSVFGVCSAVVTACAVAACYVWTSWLAPGGDQALADARDRALAVSQGAAARMSESYLPSRSEQDAAWAATAAEGYGRAHGTDVEAEIRPGAIRLTVDAVGHARFGIGAPDEARVRACFDWILPTADASARIEDVPCALPGGSDLAAIVPARHLPPTG